MLRPGPVAESKEPAEATRPTLAPGRLRRHLDSSDESFAALYARIVPQSQQYSGSGSYGTIELMGWTALLRGICPLFDRGEVATLEQWEAYRAGMEEPG